MVTIIANQLDNNYSQVQINALYTQCKKLIEDPFDFVVFVQDDEMDLLMSTKKMDGYIEGIEFHVCLLYTSPSPRDRQKSRMPSSA